jgi:hypothetical protein
MESEARVKILFCGAIGRSGLGGQAWANLQYLIGLRELGHDVIYLEDCGESSWVYNWRTQEWTTEIAYPADYVRDCLEPFGFAAKWIYRAGEESAGMPQNEFVQACAQADLLIMRAVPLWVWRKEYSLPRRRIFIDVDPGFTQMNIAGGDKGLAEAIARCEKYFTYGQNIGDSDSTIPTCGFDWLKTVPPVALSEWPMMEKTLGEQFTSIMRWEGFQNSEYKGVTYGQKDLEFPKFFGLPKRTGQQFCVAINGPELPVEFGWRTIPGEIATQTPESYRNFIQQSRAEFGVAKHGYVKMRSGWFSDRSVCYLASGKPILVQDTGLKDKFPLGEGLLTFSDLNGAVEGVKKINSDYKTHRLAARAFAEKYFATGKVLPALLETALD